MKVTFDTEADTIEDLQTVLGLINNSLQKRSGNPVPSSLNNINNPNSMKKDDAPKSQNEVFGVGNFIEAPKIDQFANGRYQQEQASQPRQQEPSGKTGGGGRVIPFEDMNKFMSDMFSRQPTRKPR